jgi:hypothetical protein
MKDLKSQRWIVVKGLLFLALGLLSAVLLIVEYRSLRGAALLVVAIWSFCRFSILLSMCSNATSIRVIDFQDCSNWRDTFSRGGDRAVVEFLG